jgi:hypothetical protein|tara:strand:+ start:181 stop:546 length:366 start_codon:yes stop_codon:yes gene_type:complete
MSHFAKINSDNIVQRVIVAEQDFIDTLENSSLWIQTSYNTRGGKHYAPNTNDEDGGVALRKNYAGIGYKYDAERDAFIAPQPFPSWTLNEDTCLWEAPVAYPNDGKDYEWNEETTSWEEIT